jgi:prepilin-type N-terminal cleavage/methylation domain-containing protein
MKNASSRWRRQAFTLIELLVVIGVIALLMGLLMPTIAGALDRARETMCASNQKQLALASFSYAGDHDGRLPNNKEWVSFSGVTDWYHPDGITNGTLFPYVKDLRVYLCPTFYRIVRPFQPGATRSYGVNYRVALKSDTGDGPQWHVEGLGGVLHPGARVFIDEEDPPYAPWYPTSIDGVTMASSAINDGRTCWANGNEYWDSATVRDAPATYHRDHTSKAAFFDGHAETFLMDAQFKWKYKMEPMAP